MENLFHFIRQPPSHDPTHHILNHLLHKLLVRTPLFLLLLQVLFQQQGD